MKRILLLACLATAAAQAAAQQCTLEYQRADNMWAAPGRPDGALGTETLTLQPGETKVFTTDWKYEKQRNDGRNYYGSHVRTVRNAGRRQINLVFRGNELKVGGIIGQLVGDRGLSTLKPGARGNVRADLMEASCPPADKQAVAVIAPPSGLAARQTSPTTIELTWQRVPDAKEYRVYVSPPPQPHLADRPGIAGASSSRWVIPLPPNVAPSTVYRASIEAVGTNGAVSMRAEFNPVAVQIASGPGGTPQTGGGTPQTGGGMPQTGGGTPPGAGQRCPPGQFVTGFDPGGKIICAAPR